MPTTDTLTRFLIDNTGVRGVLVSLDASWAEIRSRADYPDAVVRLLGEAAAATALFAGHVKVEGRLSLQLRGTGALRTLFAECTSQGTLRGLARHDGELPDDLGPQHFGEGSMLAITIETLPPGFREVQRYQGLVGLDAESLSAALIGYFRQSEQLPTAMLLAADGERAAGLLLQRMPGEGGSATESQTGEATTTASDRATDGEGWARVEALFGTLGAAELLAGPNTDLLWRLFHEDGVRILSEQALRFACSCSEARVEDMLRSLGEIEANAAIQDGIVAVHCEFCGKGYRFDSTRISTLFASERATAAPAAPGLQ